MSMKTITLIAITLIALFIAGDARGATPDDTLIVPGQRIGPFNIGMDLAKARKMAERFGPIEVDPKGGACNERGRGVCVTAEGFDGAETPGKLNMVITDDVQFKTAKGNGVGADGKVFINEFGQPDRMVPVLEQGTYLMFWDNLGLGVAAKIDDSKAVAIAIYPPQPKK